MAERTTFYFTGAHALPAIMVAFNSEAAGLAVLAYLALIGAALLSAMGDERQQPGNCENLGEPIRVDTEEDRPVRRKR
ncbi:hypothetical protein [Methyloversatilis sp.]|uniref:hypothetical protein n=1 Tax=Methyloversatilis sp. TaxID=2569862 RepID=UPI0027354FF2|nr:hypothetical protein [Methyloversatilis sp.]MDP2870355.1 hypothetical protein [Methyloversatilis sp.]MDP3289129.1 hypothetical protein [Methyloversatilis sp.]MDP3454020.1 hypothetical protein [Methyloversatilis sp.]MDP3579206.1 hypothetical protein [Methyloversatilis sp.]